MKPGLAILCFLLACIPAARAWECTQPLDAQTLNQLQLGWTDIQLRPGESHQFTLSILSTYAPAKEVPACATWKVDPEGKGASISPSGLLKIDPATPAGTRFIVTANIENGRAQRQTAIFVYTDQSQPLVGFWQQKSRSGCKTKIEDQGSELIRELEFRADGTFSVTWTPFEVYRDYWGTYEIHAASRAVSLQILHGNYVPKQFNGKGKYKVKDKATLELFGIYLGDSHGKETAEIPKISGRCRYIFTRNP